VYAYNFEFDFFLFCKSDTNGLINLHVFRISVHVSSLEGSLAQALPISFYKFNLID
jgi:hypothetical protein